MASRLKIRISKTSAALFAVSMLLQPPAASAAAIAPQLLERPVQGLNPVKPNVMFTVDDSGSMDFDWLPDYVAYVASNVYHCRDGASTGISCGGGTGPLFSGQTITQYDPPVRSSAYNGVYYDPTATYSAGIRVDGVTSLPCEGSDTACGSPWTAVYVNGFSGYPGTNSGGTINLTTAYPDTAWCTTASPSAAQKATAFIPALGGTGTGTVCRLNGIPYPVAGTSPNQTPAITAGYNYPNARNPTTGAATTCVSPALNCKFTNPVPVTGNPYYYTISQVQFCSVADAAGWGTTTCPTNLWDPTTNKYVRYGNGSFNPQAFTRVDIRPTTFLVNGVAAANPTGLTYAQEMTNFGKWYAFNRTRMLAEKTAGGIAFSKYVNTNPISLRAGYHTLAENSSSTAGFLNVTDFTTANATTWFNHFYATTPGGSTPLPDAMWRIGQYFSNASSGLSGALDPLDAATGKCQQNFHLMSTDGYWNQALSAGTISPTDQDKTVPSLANLPGATGFTPATTFPRPYYEGPTATNNYLADLAMKYWINDLRPTIANQVNDAVAPWQHVVFYGLAIGARGSVVYPTGLAAITAGTANWPVGNPTVNVSDPAAIDDLWHAAVNARGSYYNTQNPRQLAESIVAALADFTDQSGTGTAAGITAPQLSATAAYAYKTSYGNGWWGDVRKYALDLDTGAIPQDANGNPLNAPVWSAAAQIDAQAAVTTSPAVVGWDVNRKIVTINDSTNAVVAFRLGNLSTTQQASLNAGWSTVIPQPTTQSVLNYLRGDQSNEGITTANFRARQYVLGDIVFSAAVPVGAPGEPYEDIGNPGYTSFASTNASRTPMVYVGANDGMMHALVDSPVVADAGKEAWAYIPKALFTAGDPNDTAHTASPAFQIGSLTYRRGGIPLFDHRFLVNATPRIWDIDMANTNTSTPPTTGNNWRTLLVGGLGAGGRAVYALDVTTPPLLTDTEATIATSGRVKWEYTENNLGYVYDSPTLVKTYAYGWVVLVASGYNNPGGKGFLYVLNPNAPSNAGQLLQKIALPGDAGTDASPTGLGVIRAYTASRKNPYVLQAYGGDLKGNIWRFDLSDSNPSHWAAVKIATLADANGHAQPVTTGVRIEIDQNNGTDRYLFVGTGKLLGQSDISDNSVISTMYVIRDGTITAPDATLGVGSPPLILTRAYLNAVTGTSVAGFGTAAPGTRGWYQDAANATQKIVNDVYADVQAAVFAFSYPSADPCLAVLQAILFARDFSTGNSLLQSGGGSSIASVAIDSGIAGVTLVQGQYGSGASTGIPGNVAVEVTTQSGQVISVPMVQTPFSVPNKHRVSWRLMNGN